MLNDNFVVTKEHVRTFAEKGFVLLKNFYSDEFITYIQSTVGKYISTPTDKYQTGFSRLAFDMYDGDEIVTGLLKSRHFRTFMKLITGRDMFFLRLCLSNLKK